MNGPIKIMHIDGNWKIVYVIIRAGSLIKSGVSLKAAIELLKTEKFDLIVSEPHQKAILTPQMATGGLEQLKDSVIDGSWSWGTVPACDLKSC
ncbi:MAG: hypothetical protein HY892_17300 [Deltaproteobacteria bacterium]|nr:hypothetical protein [Deltaproteobacteria bacterium]